LEDLNKHNLKEYKHFFETYKELKSGEKWIVTIAGYHGREKAIACVQKSVALYDAQYAK
jgi:inorganic pyrophosphatase